MDKFRIEGGRPLRGTVRIDSSKNALLPILAASILHGGTTVLLDSVPISDVVNMVHILTQLGCKCDFTDGTITIDAVNAHAWEIPHAIAKEIRSSIFMLGSILSRFGVAKVSYPGGCDIGLRPIDLHLKGLKRLGVSIEESNGFIFCDGSRMKSGFVHLDYPSVGATENIMMSAVRLPGVTVISNAAKEPEIVDLQNFINAMGGHIRGAGSSVIEVTGVSKLHDVTYTPIPDRIIAGTFLIAGAITGGELTLERARADHIAALISKMRDSGCKITETATGLTVAAPDRLQSCQSIETQPYPGFATDLQAQMTALQTVSEGTCMVIENLFETRYKYAPELTKMGANITVRDRCAIVRGVKHLHGADVTAMDLRGGAALVLAGLCADGVTTVEHVHLVDRGYYRLEDRLCEIGGRVTRIDG